MNWSERKIPGSSIFAANFEFGTYGKSFLAEARSLRITILKNQKNLFGGQCGNRRWIDREYRELYLPKEPAWFEKALCDARQAFQRHSQCRGNHPIIYDIWMLILLDHVDLSIVIAGDVQLPGFILAEG